MGTSSMIGLPTNSFAPAAHDGVRPWSREDRIGLGVLLAVLVAGLLALVHAMAISVFAPWIVRNQLSSLLQFFLKQRSCAKP